jgi:hypothetical protein
MEEGGEVSPRWHGTGGAAGLDGIGGARAGVELLQEMVP